MTIPEDWALELVVAAERYQGPEGNADGVKDLGVGRPLFRQKKILQSSNLTEFL